MQLVYRGTTFNYQPAIAFQPKMSDTVTFELLYRGQFYRYEKSANPMPKIKAANWRFAEVLTMPTSIESAIA